MISRDVANAVTARLNRVHLHGGEPCEDVGYVLELGPVELEILPRREVSEAAIELLGEIGELAQLARAQQAVRNRDAQHRRMPLDVETVAQAERPEFLFRQLTGQEAARLIAELCNPLIDESLVQLIVLIHARTIGAPPMGTK